MTQDLLTDVEKNEEPADKQALIAANKLSEGKNVDGYGLKFLLDACTKIQVDPNVVQAILEAICKINYHQPTETIPMPEDEDNEEARDKVAEQNEEIEK